MKLRSHSNPFLPGKPQGSLSPVLAYGLLAALCVLPALAEESPVTTAPIPPSRLVSTEDLPDFIEKMSAALNIRSRASDPFGQPQDLSAKPVMKPTTSSGGNKSTAQATPFSEVIRLIKITTVMPAEKRFLVGNRIIRKGDRIPLSHRGSQIKVEISDVTSSAIEFRNVGSGEVASLQLDLMPAGMSAGDQGITPPGMVPNLPDAPLELDTGSF